MVFEFQGELLRSRYDGMVFDMECYPGRFRLASKQHVSARESHARRTEIIAKDWATILEIETHALEHQVAKELVDDCFFFRWPFIRLTFATNERELVAQNLERGYAVHMQQVPYSYQGQCQDDYLNYYTCTVNASRTQETPVPIDMQREETKLEQLDARIERLAENERNQIAQCALLPDE